MTELIDEYGKLVFSICYNITKNYFDSEDLAQETFLAAYKSIHQFQGENKKAWICKIATNKSLDYLRRGARKSILTEEEFFLKIESTEPTPEEYFLDQEVKDKIYILCNELKSPYNEVAKEHFCNGNSVKEIAVNSGKPMKTIQTQVYRARQMLKTLWGKELL